MIIFTAIFNKYDRLNEYTTTCRKICFTDQPIESRTWEIKRMDHESKVYRKIKIMPHLFLPAHDRSVWIDGSLLPLIDVEVFARDKAGYWLMDHPVRKCIYEEANACIQMRKDNPKIIQRQVLRYRQELYPVNNGLVATGVLIRDNDPAFIPVAEQWWEEVRVHSIRDQISFNYVAHKNNLKFSTFPFLEGFKNQYHVKDRRHQRTNYQSRA
jgi:hypothetical protein